MITLITLHSALSIFASTDFVKTTFKKRKNISNYKRQQVLQVIVTEIVDKPII
jgi:hypothetical protein